MISLPAASALFTSVADPHPGEYATACRLQISEIRGLNVGPTTKSAPFPM